MGLFVTQAHHDAVVAILKAQIAGLEIDRDRWHDEAALWRESLRPIRSTPVPFLAPPDSSEEPASPPRAYTQKLLQAVEDEVRMSGDPSVRTWMMAEVDRLMDSGEQEAGLIAAVRKGDTMAVFV